jgi:hypothetical protein
MGCKIKEEPGDRKAGGIKGMTQIRIGKITTEQYIILLR